MTRFYGKIVSEMKVARRGNRKYCLHGTVRVSLLTAVVSLNFSSCDFVGNKIQVTRAPSVATTVTKITPIAARPNEVVSLTGQNFSKTRDLKVSLDLTNGQRASVPLEVTDSQNASFAMPEGAGLGLKDVTLTQGRTQFEVAKFNLIADQADNQLPIIVGDSSTICSDQQYIDRNGDTKTGTKDCTALISPPPCTADGVVGCVTTETYKSANLSNLTAENIKKDVTIAGVSGNVTPSPDNCSSNGQQSCVAAGSYFAGTNCAANGSGCYLPTYALTTQPLRAIDYDNINSNAARIRTSATLGGVTGTLADCSTNGSSGCVATSTYLAGQNRTSWDMTTTFPGAGYYSGTTNPPTAGNIRNGVSIAGVAGNYPSAASPLAGADETADLSNDLATRESQLRSATNFEFFMSDGTRVLTGGDSDIAASNIRNAVNIFGITGTVTAAVAPDPWNVRIGTTINGVAGQLKVNCRNRVRTAVYNYDNPGTFAIPTTGVTSGTAIDIWDTIDDYNNNVSGLPTSIVTAWETSPGVSDTDCGGVEATAGDANVWKDVTTASGGAASDCATDGARCTMQDKITGLWWSKLQASTTWNAAWSNCQSLNHNGQTGWRLPTQKELMEAYTHGIRSAARTNWMTEANMGNLFWSVSSVSTTTSNAWIVTLAYGYTNYYKYSPTLVVCVR